MLSEHEIVAFCILRKTSFALTSTSFFIVSSGFLWPTLYNINDNITLVDVIPWVFLSRLPSQKTVLGCLLVILLSTILHPRTAHFNCPDFLFLWYANLLIHTVSLDTLSHHPVSLHYRAELFPCELMCFSNQHLTPFLSRFLIKHLNGLHEKVWVLIHFHRCLGFSESISLFNWCGPCPLLSLDRYITAVQLRRVFTCTLAKHIFLTSLSIDSSSVTGQGWVHISKRKLVRRCNTVGITKRTWRNYRHPLPRAQQCVFHPATLSRKLLEAYR